MAKKKQYRKFKTRGPLVRWYINYELLDKYKKWDEFKKQNLWRFKKKDWLQFERLELDPIERIKKLEMLIAIMPEESKSKSSWAKTVKDLVPGIFALSIANLALNITTNSLRQILPQESKSTLEILPSLYPSSVAYQ